MSSIFLYGPPGGGKTTLAASMSKLGYIPLIIDLDRKARTMQHLKPLIKAGKVRIIDFQSKLIESTFAKRVRLGPDQGQTKQPQGYYELADTITRLEEDPPDDHEICVPILDNLTRAIEHMRRWIMHLNKRNTISLPDYGTILTNLEELYDAFTGLQAQDEDGDSLYPHVIMIAHDKLEKDELRGNILIKPLIDGQMRDKSGSLMDEMYYCDVKVNKKGEAEYEVTTKPIGHISQARTSRELDAVMESDFAEIFKGEGPGKEKK